MSRQGHQRVFTRAVLVAACVSPIVGNACARTNDPVEHHALPSTPGSGARPHLGGSGGVGSGGTAHGATTSSGGSDSRPEAGNGADTGGSTATSGGSGSRSSGGTKSGSAGGSGGSGNRSSGGSQQSSAGGTTSEVGGAGGEDTGPVVPSDFGCGDAPVSELPFTRQNLRSAAADCALYHYCRFEGGARVLESEVAAYAEAPGAETLAAARAAFTQAMSLWSVAELFQFGPAASRSVSAGKDIYQGQGLREFIQSWPLTVRCRVEEQVALQGYQRDWSSVLISARGLFGLDYLLFYAGADTTCTASSTAGKAWAALDANELASRKRAYAAALGSDVLNQARAIRTAWAADGGNFRPVFVDASGYPDEAKAMTVLAWSLLYMEREVKDWKLGVPAGYTLTSPVTEPESPYSGQGTEDLRANLRGFRALFQGCGPSGEGLGFDDWLTEAGHGELAADIVTAWQGAQAAADGFPRFATATPAELDALYRSVKALTDLLKTDLFGDGSPLGLDLPEGIASDTD